MISKLPMDREPINLQGGWPTPRLHPMEAMRSATLDLFARDDIHELLKYGPEHGDNSMRSNLGAWLSSSYCPQAGSISADRIIVTNGASNGLAVILQKFADVSVTRNIWMVEPAYFLACPVFRDAGFGGSIRGVPEGPDGIDLAYFESALKRAARDESPPPSRHSKTPKKGYSKIYRHVLYMVPTFSNPSGRTMSLPQRGRLIRLARQYDVLIITDDVYDLLHWPSQQSGSEGKARLMPRMVDVDRSLEGTNEFGNAVSNGSFSKIVAPGVRVGWLESMPAFVRAMGTVGATVSGGCQAHLSSLIMNQMLSNGAVTRHIADVLIPTYSRRYNTMVSAIRRLLLPLGVKIMADPQDPTRTSEDLAGGFFLYIIFPQDGLLPPAEEIAKFALDEYSLRVAPGKMFMATDEDLGRQRSSGRYLSGARLCWAWHEEDALEEGVQRLGEVLKHFYRQISPAKAIEM
ncbi:putative Aminotransferase class I/classII domain-containing protein [Seiridium cardinale]